MTNISLGWPIQKRFQVPRVYPEVQIHEYSGLSPRAAFIDYRRTEIPNGTRYSYQKSTNQSRLNKNMSRSTSILVTGMSSKQECEANWSLKVATQPVDLSPIFSFAGFRVQEQDKYFQIKKYAGKKINQSN